MCVCISLSGAVYCEKFVFSVFLGDDIVPRLSVASAFDLKIRLLTMLLNCDVPKVLSAYYFLCFYFIEKNIFHCVHFSFVLHLILLFFVFAFELNLSEDCVS